MTNLPRQGRKRGFTLIELLVVISIISLLSSVVLSSLNVARAKARDAQRMTQLKQIATAIEFYYEQYGYYPQCASNDVCSTTGYAADIGVIDAKPAYISTIPLDPRNANTLYGYYYARGYKPSGQYTFVYTTKTTDYILSTRLETIPGQILNGGVGGWNNASLNYLLGNGS